MGIRLNKLEPPGSSPKTGGVYQAGKIQGPALRNVFTNRLGGRAPSGGILWEGKCYQGIQAAPLHNKNIIKSYILLHCSYSP